MAYTPATPTPNPTFNTEMFKLPQLGVPITPSTFNSQMFNQPLQQQNMFQAPVTPAPTIAAPQGNMFTNFMNKNIQPMVIDPTTGQSVPNPELYTNGDIAQGIGSIAQAGIGAYGMFKGLDMQQQQIDQGRDALNFSREQYDEKLRHSAAIRNQNRGA